MITSTDVKNKTKDLGMAHASYNFLTICRDYMFNQVSHSQSPLNQRQIFHESEPLPTNNAVHYSSFLEIKRFFKIFGDIAETGNYLTQFIMYAWGKSWYLVRNKQICLLFLSHISSI